MNKTDTLLSIRNLQTSFFTEAGEVRAVDGVSFDVLKGKTLGIVGESGCGKSVTSLSILRLIPEPAGRIIGGQILYQGKDLLLASAAEMRKIRGNEISMIFQDPMTSLNPVFTIGNQISEAILLHRKISKKEARNQAIEMLKCVGIPSPEIRVNDYPHQLSGGMRQRVMIAMALSCRPQLLIADEPTTALDVTIQAQILDLLQDLQEKMGMAIILITHDLGVIAEIADDVLVMYAAKVAEQADVKTLFNNPRHPYTQGLLKSIPTLTTQQRNGGKTHRLDTIPGIVPDLTQLPKGCRFQDRCSYLIAQCKAEEPELRFVNEPNHKIRCIREITLK